MSETEFVMGCVSYVAKALRDCEDLREIKLWIEGTWPPGFTPLSLNPYGEVYILDVAADAAGSTMSLEGFSYTLRVRVIYQAVTTSESQDILEGVPSRILRLGEYEKMTQFERYIREELIKCTHQSLGDLDIGDEHVCQFVYDGSTYVYGLEGRTDNWSNIIQLQFKIFSQKER